MDASLTVMLGADSCNDLGGPQHSVQPPRGQAVGFRPLNSVPLSQQKNENNPCRKAAVKNKRCFKTKPACLIKQKNLFGSSFRVRVRIPEPRRPDRLANPNLHFTIKPHKASDLSNIARRAPCTHITLTCPQVTNAAESNTK